VIGWGCAFPLSVYVPVYLVTTLDVRNTAVRMTSTYITSVVGFRCIEAMYDTSPAVVETSLIHYLTYFSTPVSFHWQETTQARKKISLLDLASNVMGVTAAMVSLTLLLSFMEHVSYAPSAAYQYVPKIATVYLHTLLVYLLLYFGFNTQALVQNLSGYSTVPIFKNPLFAR